MVNLVHTPGRMRRITFSFESLGWRRAAHEVATSRWPYDPAADTSFDDRHGTDTAGSVQPDHLGIAAGAAREGAIRYLPSPTRVTNWMLDHLPVEPATSTFVDLGCGKGRVLLIAAQRPFQRVVGVEISGELAATAAANVDRYRPPPAHLAPIEVVCADVTTLDLPAGDLVVHLYHPFEPVIFAEVLRRLEPTASAGQRRITIVYLAYTAAIAPVAAVLDGHPWLHQLRYEQSVRGHYNWLVYGT